MIVLKFGGSSVKDAGAIDRVSSIIQERLDMHPVVIVSALGSTTDRLVEILDSLEKADAPHARVILDEIKNHHENVIAEIIQQADIRQKVLGTLNTELARINRLIEGMENLQEVSARSRDAVLSFGELVSGPLLAGALESRGLSTTAVRPLDVIITDQTHGAAQPLIDPIRKRCSIHIAETASPGRIPVMGGYVGATETGILTTLGRGGSDLTASLVASLINAHRLEYWKDVDGILTADPNLVPEATVVPVLSFREAAELAFLGARVLHPSSIQPAVDAGIPVHVLNTFKPENPGTLIKKAASPGIMDLKPPGGAVASVACKRRQVLINIYSTRMLGASGFLRRVFEVFDRLGLSVDHIATSEVNVTVTMSPTDRIHELTNELDEVAGVDVDEDAGVISVVGENLTRTPGVASKLFGALEDVNVKLITYGGSGVNLSLVVRDEDLPKAVRQLHSALMGTRPKKRKPDAQL